ncbi:hypothetical protein [Tenuifilum thalassicum]|uniref:Uncharacterized protein n=1 Tax=Tenuifilum thalassicum TaxID=2590900 RepID=A0A7D3XD86_9BACT|nr:hypothetical protein [Tenuifilum thalassicum]QKG78887.1 hypothetical protein FHG85_00920 [Tenuifilum thalassicum]
MKVIINTEKKSIWKTFNFLSLKIPLRKYNLKEFTGIQFFVSMKLSKGRKGYNFGKSSLCFMNQNNEKLLIEKNESDRYSIEKAKEITYKTKIPFFLKEM